MYSMNKEYAGVRRVQALPAISSPYNLKIGLAGRSACVQEGGSLLVAATKRCIVALSFSVFLHC